VPDHFGLQTKNDPLCGFFRWGSKLFPITNSHICIVQGDIDHERLHRALERTVPRFELLRELMTDRAARAGGSTPESLVRAVHTSHPVTFDDRGFRAFLMDLVDATEPSGLVRQPLRLLLVHGPERRRTCVYLGISHDVADVKSGNIVLAALMKEYDAMTTAGTGDPAAVVMNGVTHRRHTLSALQPGWYRGAAALLRQGRAQLEIARRMLARERTKVDFSDRQGHRVEDRRAGNDFHHHVLSGERQRRLHATARHYGVTINSLFCAALTRYIGRHQESRSPLAVYTIAVSLRRLLGNAYREAFRSFMIDCTLRVPHQVGTRQLLAAIEAEVTAIRSGRLDLELGRMESAISLFRNPLPRSLVYWVMKRTQGTNLLYSNPGIVEEDLTQFGNGGRPILQTAIFGCLVHPYDLMFLTPTVNGRMQLDVVYRRESFPDVVAQFVTPLLAELDELIAPPPGEVPLDVPHREEVAET